MNLPEANAAPDSQRSTVPLLALTSLLVPLGALVLHLIIYFWPGSSAVREFRGITATLFASLVIAGFLLALLSVGFRERPRSLIIASLCFSSGWIVYALYRLYS